jgi:hypothetical protein
MEPSEPRSKYIDQPDHANSPLNALKSSDHLKIRAALIEILLNQLNQPTKPLW